MLGCKLKHTERIKTTCVGLANMTETCLHCLCSQLPSVHTQLLVPETLQGLRHCKPFYRTEEHVAWMYLISMVSLLQKVENFIFSISRSWHPLCFSFCNTLLLVWLSWVWYRSHNSVISLKNILDHSINTGVFSVIISPGLSFLFLVLINLNYNGIVQWFSLQLHPKVPGKAHACFLYFGAPGVQVTCVCRKHHSCLVNVSRIELSFWENEFQRG